MCGCYGSPIREMNDIGMHFAYFAHLDSALPRRLARQWHVELGHHDHAVYANCDDNTFALADSCISRAAEPALASSPLETFNWPS